MLFTVRWNLSQSMILNAWVGLGFQKWTDPCPTASRTRKVRHLKARLVLLMLLAFSSVVKSLRTVAANHGHRIDKYRANERKLRCPSRDVHVSIAIASPPRRGWKRGKRTCGTVFFLCIYLFVSDHRFIDYYRQTDTDGHRLMASTADA